MFGKLKNIYNILYLRILFYLHVKNSMDFPVEATKEEKEIIKLSDKYSMTGSIRMWVLLQAVKKVIKNKIEGDIVECGVWKGGNLILCQKYLNLQNVNIKIHGFDNFEGMVKPKEIDADYRNVPSSEMHSLFKKDENKNSLAYCSLEEINKNINETVPNHNIKLIKGNIPTPRWLLSFVTPQRQSSPLIIYCPCLTNLSGCEAIARGPSLLQLPQSLPTPR